MQQRLGKTVTNIIKYLVKETFASFKDVEIIARSVNVNILSFTAYAWECLL